MTRTPRHPLIELTMARILEFLRDPAALFWTFGFPILLAIALGIAFREQPKTAFKLAVDPAVTDAAHLAELLDADDDIEIAQPEIEGSRALAAGKIDVLIVAPQDETARWAYRYDPLRPESRAARLVADAALQRGHGRSDPVVTADVGVTERGRRYIDFLLPGLIALNVMGSAMWGIGFAVVDARRRKLLKRLAATPMRRSHFLLSYMLSRLVFLMVEVVALLAFGWLVFDTHVAGSIAALMALAVIGALSFTGIALLVSARPRSTETASGWANLVMLPMWLLSGAFFSYAHFPEAVQPAIRALPLTALIDAMRAVMGEAAALWTLWPELAVLAAWGVLGFGISLRVFRWQ